MTDQAAAVRRTPPLYRDAFALCSWVLGHFDDDSRALARALCHTAAELVAAVALAVKARRRADHVELADEQLIVLRTQLRLAETRGYLSAAQVAHAFERVEAIGRQIGGWLRAMDAA